MAMIKDGKVYRNIQEQVEENAKDIEILQNKALGGVLYRHHFDVILTVTDLPGAINPGDVVSINVNALSNDSEPWTTLGELDGKGVILSAFGVVSYPSISYNNIYELKLFYKAINTMLIDVHSLPTHDVGALVTSTCGNGQSAKDFPIEDSVTAIN